MFRALLRLQLRSSLAAFTRGRKGRGGSRGALLGYAVLMVYVAGVFLWLFHMMASALCAPLLEMGLGWLYFAVMSAMALALGVVGSVFQAQSQLFEARDNESLLAMPIPPSRILGARLLALYLQSLVFSALVLVPTALAYAAAAPLAGPAALCLTAAFLLLPLLTVTLSCLLGWLTALITSRLRKPRNRSM